MANEEISVEALAERLGKLESKISAFEAKYGPLENIQLRLSSSPQGSHSAVPPSPIPSVPQAKPNSMNWEHVGRVWLPIVFIVAILVGVVFAFDAAVKSGLLNQQARIVVGFIASAAILGIGELQLQKKRTTLGDVLVGASIAIMLLTTFAGNELYGILAARYAVSFGVLFTVAGLYLAKRHDSQVLAVIATISGFLIPFVVAYKTPDQTFVAIYALIVSVGFALFALSRNFRIAFYAAWGMLHFTLVCYSLDLLRVYPIYAVVALIQHVCVMSYLIYRNTQIRERYSLFYLSLAGTALWAQGLSRGDAQVEFVILAAAYLVLMVYQRKNADMLPIYVIGALYSIAMYLFFALSGQNLVLGLIIESTVGLVAGLKLKKVQQIWASSILYYVSLFLILCVSPSGTRVYGLFGKFRGEDFANYFLGTLSAFVIAYVARRENVASQGAEKLIEVIAKAFRWVAPIALILFLSNAILTVLQTLSGDLKMLSVSFLWAILAVGFIVYGINRNNKNDRAMGIVLLFVTLAKLVFVDLPFVSIVVRSVLFIGVGAIGVFASRFFYGKR